MKSIRILVSFAIVGLLATAALRAADQASKDQPAPAAKSCCKEKQADKSGCCGDAKSCAEGKSASEGKSCCKDKTEPKK